MSRARSIRTRLLAGAAVGVAAAFAVAGLLVHVLARASLEAQLDDSIAEEAHALSVLVEQEDDELDTDLGPTTLAGAKGRMFELFADDGQVMARSASLGMNELVPAELHGSELQLGAITLPDGSPGRQATLGFFPRQEPGDTAAPIHAVIVVARSTAEVDDAVGRLDGVLAIAGAAAIALCLGLLAWITRYGLAPMTDLARRIAELDPADPAVRLGPDRTLPPELVPIVDRLDELLGRLTAVVARERELTAEVAHELRTPLAGLRSTIELALAREREPAHYRGALAQCLAIVEQTHRMVEALLALARLDAGAVTAARRPVALAAVIDDAVALVAARAERRGLTIARTGDGVTAATDGDRIRVVIQNLLDNAVSHADEHGTIRIELGTTPDTATIRIANTGSRVGGEATDRVFERFWRGDAARTAGEHAGLGLALCRKLVALVGGTIAVEAAVGGEFVVTVGLPAA